VKRLLAICALCLSASAAQASGLAYTTDTGLLKNRAVVLLDVRPLAQCERGSVAGAKCLPAEDLLGPHGSLPDFRQIMWLFGTEGLAGGESVLVLGNRPERRDFVAGLLYLAGQREVQVMRRPLDSVLKTDGVVTARGQRRSQIADPIYQGVPRDGLIVLRAELHRALTSANPPRLLDGRPADAYAGQRIEAARGGHIPGAESFPYASLKNGSAVLPPVQTLAGAVVYAAGPESGIAYFTRLQAALDANVRVYIGGWREWAAHTALPADDVTYAGPSRVTLKLANNPPERWPMILLALVAALGGGLLAAGTVLLTRRSHT
jgi:thiosulfate/3-mercaptopyruvate sulfurtransferase